MATRRWVRSLAAGGLVLLLALSARAASVGEETLTNRDVTLLLRAGLDPALVIKKIEKTKADFDTSPDALVELKKHGVPDAVIDLMLDRAESQTSRERSRISLVIQNLASRRDEIRDAAGVTLRQYGPRALPQIREALGHTRPEVRAAAARFLGEAGDTQSVPLLRHLLTDTDREAREAAGEALAALGDAESRDTARARLLAGGERLEGHIRLLARAGEPRAVSPLRTVLLEHSDPAARTEAARALGVLGAPEARATLEHALLRDREATVRRAAAVALGRLADPRSAAVLIEACRKDPETRAETLAALADYPYREPIAFLFGTLRHRLAEEEVRLVLDSLRKLTHQDFGTDPREWDLWWKTARRRFPPLAPAVARAERAGGTQADATTVRPAPAEPPTESATDSFPGPIGAEGRVPAALPQTHAGPEIPGIPVIPRHERKGRTTHRSTPPPGGEEATLRPPPGEPLPPVHSLPAETPPATDAADVETERETGRSVLDAPPPPQEQETSGESRPVYRRPPPAFPPRRSE